MQLSRAQFMLRRIMAVLVVFLPTSSNLARCDDGPKDEGRVGRLLVYARDTSPLVPDNLRFRGLLSVDPKTGNSKQVGGPDLELGSLSHDGRFLAGVAFPAGQAGGRGEVRVYDLTKEQPARKVFDRPGVPSWSKNGTQIVIGAKVALGHYETFRVNRDGSDLTKLPIPEDRFVVDCSCDGSWLGSWTPRRKTREGHILFMHADGTDVREVVNEVGAGGTFRISHDGREVVYSLIQTEKAGTQSTLWIVGINGLDRREIPIKFAPGEMVAPRWSPDGSKLALGVTWNGRQNRLMENQILIVDRDGKNVRTLSLPPWKPILLDWK